MGRDGRGRDIRKEGIGRDIRREIRMPGCWSEGRGRDVRREWRGQKSLQYSNNL